MQKCAKKQSYFFTIAFLITFCCVLINKLSFYTDCPKIPELVKQCFSNLSMSKCLIVSALSSAFPNDFPIFCVYRLIKSIYLQKCTVHDKLRTVHFFLFNITFSQFFKQEVISDYLFENIQLQRCQIQEHLGHIPQNYLLSQQFLKVLLQSPITQS